MTKLSHVSPKKVTSSPTYPTNATTEAISLLNTSLVSDHQIICIEDTERANMTRPAKGTAEQPGKNVKQKSGLNRSILAQGWYRTRQKLEYKSHWYGRQFVPVPTHHTSQHCSERGHADAGNRVSQPVFKCLSCGHETNADTNSSENIRRQDLQILAKAGNPPRRTAGDLRGQQPQCNPSHDGPALYA